MIIGTMRAVASDGVETGARFAGEDGDPVLFIHGVGSTAAVWDDQLRAFSERRRCYAVELRGNGTMTDPADLRAISREGYARDVLAVADAAGIARFDIVGCSLGGVVAFELWQRVRSRIASMTFVGSFAHYPNARAYIERVVDAVRVAGSMRTFAEERVMQLGLPAHRVAETLTQMACKSVDAYVAATHATWAGDYRDLLPSIDVPVLVLCGEHDTIAPLILSQEIATGIPDARLDVVADAGHVCNADAPQTFNSILDSFLRERSRGGSKANA